MLLKTTDWRPLSLSSHLFRTLLLAVCFNLLGAFVDAADSPAVQELSTTASPESNNHWVPIAFRKYQLKDPYHQYSFMTSKCCLKIGESNICSPTEHLASDQWEHHGPEYVVNLGSMYFGNDAWKQHIINSLEQFLATNLVPSTALTYVHRALHFLSIADSGLELLTTAITRDTIDNFQTIIKMEEESTNVQVTEIKRRSNYRRTGGVEISVDGSEVMEFIGKATQAESTTTPGFAPNFVATVYFTRPLMKEALERIKEKAMSTSSSSPSWLIGLARKEKCQDMRDLPRLAAGWVKADKFMQLLSEEDSGWSLGSKPGVNVKAISENTMVNWRRYRDTRAALFLREKVSFREAQNARYRNRDQVESHKGHTKADGPSH
ncbi:hypothetical protein EV361DRAFT_954018 [Lentinula raphanica]|nr:hypothetical protein EV361DRAFT_954018 [Lentinula raphanica]